MAIAHGLALAGFLELLERVLAHGLQQPIAHARSVRVDLDERVLGERLEGGEDLRRREPSPAHTSRASSSDVPPAKTPSRRSSVRASAGSSP